MRLTKYPRLGAADAFFQLAQEVIITTAAIEDWSFAIPLTGNLESTSAHVGNN